MTGRTSGRTHGRIYVDIWSHMAEHNLSRDARHVYPFLVCQAKLSLCGAMDIRMRSWAKQLAMPVDELNTALLELVECNWLHIDDDTEELWITGFIDREVNVANSKTMKGALRAVNRVESSEIRQLALDALAAKGGDTTLLNPKDEGSISPDTSGDVSGDRPPDASRVASYLIPDTSTTTSQPTGLTRAVDNPQDFGDQQLADQWIDAHVEHRRQRIRHPNALRGAIRHDVLATIAEARARSDDPRPLLNHHWPITPTSPLWHHQAAGDDLYGLGPPPDSPLARLHQRLTEAGLRSAA